MDITLIFVIVVMFLVCVVFPLHMRRYMTKRQQRLNSQSRLTTTYVQSVPQQNTNLSISSEERLDHRLDFHNSHTTPPNAEFRERDDAATRHLEAEHRQQIIAIQREIEQLAVQRQDESDRNGSTMPRPIINSSTVRDPAAFYSQQIIDLQREIERQAIQRQDESNGTQLQPQTINSSTVHDPETHYSQQIIDLQSEIERQAVQRLAVRQEERRPDLHSPHMPPRWDSNTYSSVYTIASDRAIDVSNYTAPPLTPDADREKHIRYLDRLDSKDDELPSYEQAVAFNCKTSTVTMSRFESTELINRDPKM